MYPSIHLQRNIEADEQISEKLTLSEKCAKFHIRLSKKWLMIFYSADLNLTVSRVGWRGHIG